MKDFKEHSISVTKDRLGTHPKIPNTRKKEGLVSSNIRKNRPLTSIDISTKIKPTRLKISEDLCKTKNRSIQQSSTQNVFVNFSLRDVPVKGNGNASKTCKYKSYNLINAQKSERKLIQARHDLQGNNDRREKFLLDKNHVGKINRIADTRLRSAKAPKASETTSKGNANHTKDFKGATKATHEDETVASVQEAAGHEKRTNVIDENWSETLKSCRYLRKPRGEETPEIPIESIFQND